MIIIDTLSSNRLWSKHAVKIAWAIGLLCLLVALISIIWTSVSQSTLKKENYQAQKIRPLKKSTGPLYRVNDIVAANLFGDPTPPPAPVVKKAPKTTLDLTLQGILWASDNSMARAIIMSGKKKSNLYSVGEKIKGAGASIKEIRDGEVILNRNGALESLSLIKKKGSGNRRLFTYNNPNSNAPIAAKLASSRATNKGRSRTSTKRPKRLKARSKQETDRKIRRPNFSGLDRALEKMGEL